MNVTRDVIIDLWPLYLTGEASDDSRRLVEEYLRQDPEFARLNGESPDRSLRVDRIPPPGREDELTTLRRTKRLVRIREALFWFAIFLSAAPLTMYDTSWGRGSLIRDVPWVACGLGAGAVILWCFYYALRRRLSATGL